MIKTYFDGATRIDVEIEDTAKRFAWRMAVNGDWSDWTTRYPGVLAHKDWCLTTDYWAPQFPAFVPFRIVYAAPAESK